MDHSLNPNNRKNDEIACYIGNKPTKLHCPYIGTRQATEALQAAHVAGTAALYHQERSKQTLKLN
jgi:hypothetical protein